MKTLILSFLLIFGLTHENLCKPIIDIYSLAGPEYTEESYINNILFNTNDIAVAVILDGKELKLEDEAYIDDIPFNTKAIANQYLLNKKIKCSDEANSNDLPFDTQKVFYEKLTAGLTEQYQNETGINDLPRVAENNFCCYEISISPSVSILIKTTGRELIRQ